MFLTNHQRLSHLYFESAGGRNKYLKSRDILQNQYLCEIFINSHSNQRNVIIPKYVCFTSGHLRFWKMSNIDNVLTNQEPLFDIWTPPPPKKKIAFILPKLPIDKSIWQKFRWVGGHFGFWSNTKLQNLYKQTNYYH